MSSIVNRLDKLAAEHLAELGYAPMGPLGERHGSLERFFSKKRAGEEFTRLISQAYTEIPSERGKRFAVAITAGAHEDRGAERYQKSVILQTQVDNADRVVGTLKRMFEAGLNRAEKLARALSIDDLSIAARDVPDRTRGTTASASGAGD